LLEAWVVLSITAAFFQNLRSALQKHLKNKLSNSTAAYTRFLYALPFVLIYVALAVWIGNRELPALNARFFQYCLAGSIAQILFTVVLLWMFSFKSFAAGTTFSKLEVVVVAILGAIFLGDGLSAVAILSIIICTLGVIALTAGQSGIKLTSVSNSLFNKVTLAGLLCAFFLGASVVFFRGAALALDSNDVLIVAAVTLAVALCMQTILMGIWIALREPGQWKKLLQQWRWATVIGAAGAITSVAWFTAFTLQNASYVRALGSIELLFTYLFSTRIFREKVPATEVAGMGLIVAGILILLLLA